MHPVSLHEELLYGRARVHEHPVWKHWFPIPRVFNAPTPGIDISDSSVKAITLKPARSRGFTVELCVSENVPEGAVVGGLVRDPERLGGVLKTLYAKMPHVHGAHVALPEEGAYVFNMHIVDVRDPAQVRTMIEFEMEGRVPIKLERARYDYDVISIQNDGMGAEIAVYVFPGDLVQDYLSAFAYAGVPVRSMELEARSIARAIIPPHERQTFLIADFGRARTGVAIVKNGIPIFTSTVEVGGDSMTRILTEQFKMPVEEAENAKNEYGIEQAAKPEFAEAMIGTASALADEIIKHFRYWDTRRDERGERITPVSGVLLVGGSSNLKGLETYLAGRVQARTQLANVWHNVCHFDDYIPPVDKHHSLGYATAVGLALRDV